MKITFFLNGTLTAVEAEPDLRVIDLLRDEMHLTGTKESCGSGECGACSILVNGASMLACLMIAAQIDGAEVMTIEGAAVQHPEIISSFEKRGAVQCGYCSPGMVISAVDFLNRKKGASRNEIRKAISGNLCRCTGYQKIVDAIEDASHETEGKNG